MTNEELVILFFKMKSLGIDVEPEGFGQTVQAIIRKPKISNATNTPPTPEPGK